MRGRLANIQAAALLLQRELDSAPTQEFLEAAPLSPIKNLGLMSRDLTDLADRAARSANSAALSTKAGVTKAGPGKAVPPGTISPQAYCAFVIARSSLRRRGSIFTDASRRLEIKKPLRLPTRSGAPQTASGKVGGTSPSTVGATISRGLRLSPRSTCAPNIAGISKSPCGCLGRCLFHRRGRLSPANNRPSKGTNFRPFRSSRILTMVSSSRASVRLEDNMVRTSRSRKKSRSKPPSGARRPTAVPGGHAVVVHLLGGGRTRFRPEDPYRHPGLSPAVTNTRSPPCSAALVVDGHSPCPFAERRPSGARPSQRGDLQCATTVCITSPRDPPRSAID
ncbi:hypothetical protein SAMN05444161_6802 [Rhizobiales bacterium GAS191]|nr:hypothetical protein SAMN05444161_6802 [Rhizobiales bacterium GAS191]